MSVTFRLMWLMWLGTLIYSFGATALGIFPARSLADRLSDNFDTAFFIGSVWLAVAIINRGLSAPHQSSEAK